MDFLSFLLVRFFLVFLYFTLVFGTPEALLFIRNLC